MASCLEFGDAGAMDTESEGEEGEGGATGQPSEELSGFMQNAVDITADALTLLLFSPTGNTHGGNEELDKVATRLASLVQGQEDTIASASASASCLCCSLPPSSLCYRV